MKRGLPILLLLITHLLNAQPVAKKVIAEHFTNTYCSVCTARNPGFYANLAQFPQVLHIAYYPSAPYPACPLNQYNMPENDARTNFYGIYGSTPRLVIQGSVIAVNAGYSDPALFQSVQGQTTAFDLQLSLTPVSATEIEVRAVIKKVSASSISVLELYGAIVEDSLSFPAQNGEVKQYDVFRRSVWGAPLNIPVPATIGDSVAYTQLLQTDAAWNRNSIYAIAMLQETDHSMVQAARSAHLPITTAIPDVSSSRGIYPNPAGDRIFFESPGKPTRIIIRDLTGRIVKDETVRENYINIASLSKGVYCMVQASGGAIHTFKLIKE